MVYRIFVEKKKELAHEAKSLLGEAQNFLGIKNLEDVHVINRYDVENITKELFDIAAAQVFSEPQLDIVTEDVDTTGYSYFVTEYLPGQFDQRADSAAQCIQLISCGDKPTVKTAKVFLLSGKLTDEDIEKLKHYVINPVESREAKMDKPETLTDECFIPTEVETITGFCSMDDEALKNKVKELGLAMDDDDLRFCRDYFRTEQRDPTITEIRMIDTYWSDHCRHTTFLTTIDSVKFEDELLQASYERYIAARKSIGRTKPVNLMDVATIASRLSTGLIT